MRVADTSFLYALFSATDRFHTRALREAERPEGIIIPPEIFGETLALIHYRQGFDPARAAGAWIRAQGHVEVGMPTADLLEAAWREFDASRGHLSYPDAVVVSWCRGREFSPLALDTHILASLRP